MKKILITGFTPFGGRSINPSELIIKAIDNRFSEPGIEITTLLLPVDFELAFNSLSGAIHSATSYDFILMLGQAAGRNSICLERVALNWMEAPHKDEDGRSIRPRNINPKLPAAVISELPLDQWQKELSLFGQVSVSLSAGAYVCNYIYFRSLCEIQPQKANKLFVHLPALPEQLEVNEIIPTMELEKQVRVIYELVKSISKHNSQN